MSNIVMYAVQAGRLLLPFTAKGAEDQHRDHSTGRLRQTLGCHSLWLVNDAITDLKDVVGIIENARTAGKKPNLQIAIDRMRDTLKHVETDPMFQDLNLKPFREITAVCIADLEKMSGK